MATRLTLQGMVGYRLGITLSATTTPNTTDVNAWLQEGQLDVGRRIDPTLAPVLVDNETITPSGTTHTISSLTKPFVRLLAFVYKQSTSGSFRIAQIVSSNEFMTRVYTANSLFVPTNDNPLCCVHEATIEWSPTTGTSPSAYVVYVHEPTTFSVDGTECDLPTWLEDLVVDYALIKAKIQDEQFDQAQLLWRDYLTTIAILNQQAATRRFE